MEKGRVVYALTKRSFCLGLEPSFIRVHSGIFDRQLMIDPESRMQHRDKLQAVSWRLSN
jgi:hypothetical protein